MDFNGRANGTTEYNNDRTLRGAESVTLRHL
jgi:hypothetical protein